jgi:threonine dehydrogenase-like Zn-dependent dehydrogenase
MGLLMLEFLKCLTQKLNSQPILFVKDNTTTNICGSDLHMYEETTWNQQKILGHENMGKVVEIGNAVTQIKKVGDMVCLPFNIIGCGHCQNCESGFTGCV